MKKVATSDLISLKKSALIILFAIMILSFSSCASLIDALLGETACAHPGCNSNASGRTPYCHFHVPPTISENEPVNIDYNNAYKLHKPIEPTDIKIKRKN